MSVVARLTAFAAAAVLVAGTGAVLGTAVGPLSDGHDDGGHGDGHGGDAHGSAQVPAAPPGLAVTADGFTLAPALRTLAAGTSRTYPFRVLDEEGAPVREFDLAHERRMHLIVVRRDLTGFRHLHPRMGPDGTWRVDLRIDRPGTYRVFADFSSGGRATTLGTDLVVPGPADARPLPAPAAVATAGPYRVGLDGSPVVGPGDDGEMVFRVSRGGTLVTDLQPHLGARGHLVALREGDLAFLHVHPLDSATAGAEVRFRVEWPSAGRYRLFLQVRHDGRVLTAPFTMRVTP